MRRTWIGSSADIMSESKQPLVSIVTVCLNSGATIRDTLDSVRQQSYPEIEHIIIDGVSTDNTLQIVEEFSDSVSSVISEKDRGIYDAMNKGIKAATGDIVYFLNSDDSLCDSDVLTNVVSTFNNNPEIELLYGNAVVVTKDGQYQRKFNWLTKRNLIYSYLCHQVIFTKKSVFNEVGEFDLSYRIVSDFDWLLRVFNAGVKTCYLDMDIANFWGEGQHMSDQSFSDNERQNVKLKYQNHIAYKLGHITFRIMRKFRKLFLNSGE